MDKIQIFENSAIMVLIILTSAFRTAAGISSRCEAGSVYEGEPANVTCHFDDDIRNLQLDVNVNRFEPEPVRIFSCAWFGAEPDIFTDPGVMFVGNISNKLTLKIIHANKERFGGRYKCQVAKSLPQEAVPCTLDVHVNGKVLNSSQTTNMISKETEISSSSSEPSRRAPAGGRNNRQEKGTDVPLGPVIGGVVVALVGVSGLVFVYFWRKKKARKRHDGIVYTVADDRSTTWTCEKVQKNNAY